MALGEVGEPAAPQRGEQEEPFSWHPLLADKLIGKDDKGKLVTLPTSSLNGKHVLIYFSAHWCPPCRQFTPRLVDTYAALKAAGHDVEIVFVSMDRDQAAFDTYFDSMPWLAVPFQDDTLRSVLSRKLQVQGIPALTVLAPDSTVLCDNARAAVAADPGGLRFPWRGMAAPKAPPIPWLLLAFLVWWLVNTFLFPGSKKNKGGGGGADEPAAS